MPLPWFVSPLILFSSGVALLLCAIIIPFRIEEQIDDKLVNEFLFTDNTSTAYKKWQTNNQPDSSLGFVELYIYNCTNAADVTQNNAKPILKEIGPFYYQQYLDNVNTSFWDFKGERVVTTIPWIYLIFNRTLSVADQDILITLPGLGYWGLINSYPVRSDPSLMAQLRGAYGIFGFPPFITQTLQSWLYGYTDPVLTLIQSIRPDLVKNNVVGLFRNQTSPDDALRQVNTSTVSCGYPNAKRFQQMIFWQGSQNVTLWDPPLEVQGSPGNFFGFRREGQSETEVHFYTTIARTVLLNHTSTGSYKGIKTYRYTIDPKEWNNATLNPKNAQFSQGGWNGFFNLTAQFLAGIWYCRGHFLGVDPSVANLVEGVPPGNPDVDETWFDIEPLTGAAIRSYKPLQENLLFGNFVAPELNVNVSTLLPFPMLQMQINSDISAKQAEDLQNNLDFYEDALLTENLVLYGGALLGSVLLLAAAWLTHHRREHLKQEDAETLISEDAGYGT
jgi:hypothetical protein